MSTLEEQALSEKITITQLNAIMGSLLGDASINQNSKVAAYIRWNHGVKQKNYVSAKYTLLSEHATRPPFEKPNPGFGNTWCSLTLKSLGTFRLLYQMLYPDGTRQKRITTEYLLHITHPIALAWLWLDDGSRQKGHNNGVLCTNSYSKEDVEILREWLSTQWGLEAKIREVTHTLSKKTSWVLDFCAEAFTKMVTLITPYVPESMKYKTALMTRTCPVCGKVFTVTDRNKCCSEECLKKYRKENSHQYYLEHKDRHQELAAKYREEHKEEIAAQKKAWAANMTEEQKEEKKRRCRERMRERLADPEEHAKILARRRERRAELQQTEEFRAKKREEDRLYRERLKADPERWAAYQQKKKERNARRYKKDQEG